MKHKQDGFHLKSFCGGGNKEFKFAVKRKSSYLQHYNVTLSPGIMIYSVIVEKQEQNKLSNNTFGGQTCVKMFTTYVQSVILVNALSTLQRTMDIYQLKKQRQLHGKSYV